MASHAKISNFIWKSLEMNAHGVDFEPVGDSTLFEEVGIDSLDLASVVLDIETEFGIEISGETLRSVRTPGELVDLTMSLVKIL